MSKQFIKFLITSGLAALINVIARLALSLFIMYEIAVFIAYLFGMLSAYLLARSYVFEASGQSVQREVAGFILVNIVALIQVWAVSVGLYRFIFPRSGWTFEPALIAHMIGVASPAFTSYFGHKYISFGKKS